MKENHAFQMALGTIFVTAGFELLALGWGVLAWLSVGTFSVNDWSHWHSFSYTMISAGFLSLAFGASLFLYRVMKALEGRA